MTCDRRLIALMGHLSILTVLSLGACTADDAAIAAMERNSHFEETGAGRYRFTAIMNREYPADDATAEALRRRWLREDLAMSNRCARGANITDCEVIVTGRDEQTGAPTGEIVYEGGCF
jgi:hypothetical protein